MTNKSTKSCPICLDSIPKDEKSKIDSCNHEFCHGCIVAWSNMANTCPVCRNRFNSIQKGRKKLKVEQKDLQVQEDFSLWDPAWFDSDLSDAEFSDDTDFDSEREDESHDPNTSDDEEVEVIDLDPSDNEVVDLTKGNQKRPRFDTFVRSHLEGKSFSILVENSWHIDRCLGKAIVKNEPQDYFKLFFDLRKEFKKSFRINANLAGIIDYFELKKGFLFAPIEYCHVIYEIICKMLEGGHYFKKCEQAVFAEESSVVKLRGLPWQATENDIVEFFSPQRIDSIEFILNNQGSPTGEAFVIFDNHANAQKSLEMDQKKMGRRYIEIFPSSIEEMNHALQIMFKNLQAASVLRMRGLPYYVTVNDILQFFDGLEISEEGIWIDLGSNQKPNGTAYVQFASIKMLNEALKRNKEKMGNRYIELFRSSQDELMAKLSQYEVPQISPYICRISNFPREYHEVEIAHFFNGLNIRSQGIHLVFNENNESTGDGFIEFEKEEDIIMALKKSGQVINKQIIQILQSNPYEMLSSHQQ